ncbi:MAG: hypothetical protein GC184_14230 [Rhizobiales bacterium]|nr:hypothetical protein [Hyphomicrobiales bacterium]
MFKFVHVVAAGVFLAAGMVSVASASSDDSDITTGADLTSACTAYAAGAETSANNIKAASCKGFLVGMVTGMVQSGEAGAPTIVRRAGPNGDQDYCFYLPKLLKYSDFAQQVVDMAPKHPELADRPAIELAGLTLSKNYPCKSE